MSDKFFQRYKLGWYPFPRRVYEVREYNKPGSYHNLISHSYDYGSSIRESRALSPKFDELKRQALFIRSSPQFRKTDWIGDTSTGIPGVTVNGSAAFVTLLKNPDSGTGFFIVRQVNSTST